jgi:hypothetical protein
MEFLQRVAIRLEEHVSLRLSSHGFACCGHAKKASQKNKRFNSRVAVIVIAQRGDEAAVDPQRIEVQLAQNESTWKITMTIVFSHR